MALRIDPLFRQDSIYTQILIRELRRNIPHRELHAISHEKCIKRASLYCIIQHLLNLLKHAGIYDTNVWSFIWNLSCVVNVIFFSLFNLLCLFSPKAPRLTRRGILRLSFQFRMEIEKPDKKLASSPGIYNHSLGVREGTLSRYFLGPQMLVAFKGPFLLCNSHLPHLYIVLIWLYPGIVD